MHKFNAIGCFMLVYETIFKDIYILCIDMESHGLVQYIDKEAQRAGFKGHLRYTS